MCDNFTLKNRGEVNAFEELLCDYIKEKVGFAIGHISLLDAFNKLQNHKNGSKIFTSLLDIQINNALLQCDIVTISIIWNKLSKEQRNKGSVLDTKINFTDKMDIHKLSTSFIFCYRALWDKIMGLYIMILSHDDYDKFCTANSRKKCFRKIMSNLRGFPPTIVDEVEKIITDFDNKFRTSEAHGTGRLRKWSLSMKPFHQNPQVLLIGFCNAMNKMIISIGDMIKTMPKF